MLLIGHLGIGLAVSYLVGRIFWKGGNLAFDYRIVLIGTMLPDILDKPVGYVLGLNGGRLVAHTLVFTSSLSSLSLVLIFLLQSLSLRLKTALLFLPIGTWVHLLLDRMWDSPEVLLWPSMGWGFPLGDFEWMEFLSILQDPWVFTGEVLGFLALLSIGIRHKLLSIERIKSFALNGKLQEGTSFK